MWHAGRRSLNANPTSRPPVDNVRCVPYCIPVTDVLSRTWGEENPPPWWHFPHFHTWGIRQWWEDQCSIFVSIIYNNALSCTTEKDSLETFYLNTKEIVLCNLRTVIVCCPPTQHSVLFFLVGNRGSLFHFNHIWSGHLVMKPWNAEHQSKDM